MSEAAGTGKSKGDPKDKEASVQSGEQNSNECSDASSSEGKAEKTPKEQFDKSEKIIRNHVIAAAGAGLIPVPVLDTVSITGIQLNMIRCLSNIYGVSFDQDKGRTILTALLSGLAVTSLGRGAIGSLVKAIPVVGTLSGVITVPALAGAATRALGVISVRHLAKGEPFFELCLDDLRKEFDQELKKSDSDENK